MGRKYAVLMVCMGNICRSPTAEGVLRHQLNAAGLAGRVLIDSAGTHDYHVGAPPDERSRHHASLRGYDLSALRARHVSQADFEEFDMVLAMDWDNLAELQDECPPQYQHKLHRLMEFAEAAPNEVVADPYYGGQEGFEEVLDHVEAACAGLLKHIRAQLSERGD